MIKPTFPKITKIPPADIKATRLFYRMSREDFSRFFPVTASCIKAWENGFRNPYGPGAARLQELKSYADNVKAEKEAVLANVLKPKEKR